LRAQERWSHVFFGIKFLIDEAIGRSWATPSAPAVVFLYLDFAGTFAARSSGGAPIPNPERGQSRKSPASTAASGEQRPTPTVNAQTQHHE
jgi:hypothetical protein